MAVSLVEQVKGPFNSTFEAFRYRDAEIEQGIEGERVHALNVMEWVQKLEPNASEELKVAALFHDIDRVVNPGVGQGFSGKRNTPEYFAYKKAHTKRSADFTASVLQQNNVNPASIERICFLIQHHDDTGPEVEALHDHEAEILVAADTFSLFDTTGIKIYEEGEDRFRDKLTFMIGKMPKFAQQKLKEQKLENPNFERIKNEVIAALHI